MIMNIGKKTRNIRYKGVKLIMKYITPKLLESIHHSTFSRNHIKLMKDINPINVRPAIQFIKNIFKDKDLIGLELGVNRGLNAKSIIENLNIKKLFLVDIWKNYYYIPKNANKNYLFVKQIFKNDNRIEIIKGKSLEVCKNFNNMLDFIYIDSNHSYNDVYNDLLNWITKIKINGIISGHDIDSYSLDYEAPQVYPAVIDFCSDYGYVFYIDTPDFYFIKRE